VHYGVGKLKKKLGISFGYAKASSTSLHRLNTCRRMLGMQREIYLPAGSLPAVQPETRFLLGVIQARAGPQPHSSFGGPLLGRDDHPPPAAAAAARPQAMFQGAATDGRRASGPPPK